MKVNHISSNTNALLKRIRALHERKQREKHKQFLVEGERAVAEAFLKQLRVEDVLVTEPFLQHHPDALTEHEVDTVNVVDEKTFKELSTTVAPAGIMAVAAMPVFKIDDLFDQERTLIVVANGIQDPGNLGTLVRTALAASSSGVVLTKGTVDPFNPKVVRAAMGALFAMPIVWDWQLEEVVAAVKSRNARVIGCDATGPVSLFDADFRGPTALVFGNEGNGFAPQELQLMDEIVSIPMNPQSESLNVSVSAAVALFNVVRQRIKS